MPIPSLQDAELKALTELCGEAMAQAASTLSRLTGKGVSIAPPRPSFAETIGTSQYGGEPAGPRAIGLHLQIVGAVRGSILILFPEAAAARMLELLLGGPVHWPLSLGELERSALQEVANIIGSACLNGLGARLKMTMLPSPPTLVVGESTELLREVSTQATEGEPSVLFESRFTVGDALCDGDLFLIPAASSLAPMLAALVAP